jgi:uncharacterized membrane protein
MESLHPLTVHFPIALLLTALLVETLALVGRRPSWHRISLWNLMLGAVGAAAAVITGRLAEETAKHSFAIHQVMSVHERMGYLVLALAVIAAGWRLRVRDRLGVSSRRLVWAVLAIACGIMVFGAHLGGRLVYEYGVGGVYGRSTSGIQIS